MQRSCLQHLWTWGPCLVPAAGTDSTEDGQDRTRGYPEMSPFLFLLLLLRTRRGCTVLRSGKGAQGCQIDLNSSQVDFTRAGFAERVACITLHTVQPCCHEAGLDLRFTT